MTPGAIREVRNLAVTVAELCDSVEEERLRNGGASYVGPSRLSGELRRRSMDLTRALADMRRP